MTGNHYANNQKDPYVSTAHIPVELTLYGLARYTDTEMTIIKRRRPTKVNTPFKKKIWEVFDG